MSTTDLRATSTAILRETSFTSRLAQNLYKARSLINDNLSVIKKKDDDNDDKNDDHVRNLALSILWARLLHHTLTLLGDDASRELAECSLDATRRALITIDNNNRCKNNNCYAKEREALCYMIRDASALLHRGIRIAVSSYGARVMIAARDAPPNSTICAERPFASWSGIAIAAGLGAISEDDAAGDEAATSPASIFSPQPSRVKKVEKAATLWCPDLYLADAITTFLSKDNVTRQECRDIASLRANCHHFYGGNNSSNSGKTSDELPQTSAEKAAARDGVAIFDALSKIQHSCSPNCFYDGTGHLFTSKAVPQGTALGFSYCHRKILIRGTAKRREAMENSHNFLCGCPRCTQLSPLAHGRSFVCKACPGRSDGGGTVVEATSTALANNNSKNKNENRLLFINSTTITVDGSDDDPSLKNTSWICVNCRDTPSTTEMNKFLSVEARLERSTSEMLILLNADEVSPTEKVLLSPAAAAAATVGGIPKNAFERIRVDILECISVLGKRHWLYLECVRTAMQLFVKLATMRTSTEVTRSMALETALRWTMKFVAAARAQKLMEDAPTAVASYSWEPPMALLKMCGNSTWRIHAGLLIKTIIDTDSSFAARNRLPAHMLELAEKSMKIYSESPDVLLGGGSGSSSATSTATTTTVAKTALDAVCRAAEIDVPDDELLSLWEKHLADRVSALLQQTQHPMAAQVRAQLKLPAPQLNV